MANILDEIEKLSREELCYELALIDCVGVINVAKAFTNKAVSKVLNVTNHLLSVVSDNRIEYDGADNLGKLLIQKKLVYDVMPIESLREAFRGKIRERLDISDDMAVADDYLAVMLVDECAGIYKISDSLTPYQKTDAIYKEYQKVYIKGIFKYLYNQSKEAAKITDEKIYEAIVRLPLDQRIRLKNTLCVPEFSRKQISQSIRQTGGRRIIERLTEFIGFDVFDNAEIVTDVTYDSVTLFNRPERIVLGYIVWRLARNHEGDFEIKDDRLPSYVISTQREKEARHEKEYFSTVKRYEDARDELTRLRVELDKQKQVYGKKVTELNDFYGKREGYKERYEKLTAEHEENKRKSEQAKAELDVYVDNNEIVSGDEKYRKLKSDASSFAKKEKSSEKELTKLGLSIREYFETVKKRENEVEVLKKNITYLEKKIDDDENAFTEITKAYDYAVDFEHYMLKTRWYTCFYELAFEENVLKNVVKEFNHSQILNIERALIELSSIDEIESYSKGRLKKKDSNLNYMPFMPSEGVEGVIVYTKPTDTERKVFVAAIIKNVKE